jgi:hypothetical protein
VTSLLSAYLSVHILVKIMFFFDVMYLYNNSVTAAADCLHVTVCQVFVLCLCVVCDITRDYVICVLRSYSSGLNNTGLAGHMRPRKIFCGPAAIGSTVLGHLIFLKLIKYNKVCIFFKQVQIKSHFFLHPTFHYI